ncbi:MAG: aminoacyl-tRNA hydrolase [Chloroflexi bacterium]|nr:aminoacyl-tRNA hydrolase [Chloroflexota bacterium]
MKLIVGLGNPGRGYASSLHNLGFMCVNHFARTNHIWFDKKQGKARIGSGQVAGYEVVVARPQTYMNRSGEAVSRLVKKFNISLADLLVIHDDLDLPLGKLRIRPDGSSAGHKGIESIIRELGSHDFLRIRVGIGRPISPTSSTEITDADMITYLLSDLPLEVKGAITQVVPRVSEAILCLLSEGQTAAMNKYN